MHILISPSQSEKHKRCHDNQKPLAGVGVDGRGGGGAVGSLPTEGHSFGVPSDLTTSRTKDTTVAAILSQFAVSAVVWNSYRDSRQCPTETNVEDNSSNKTIRPAREPSSTSLLAQLLGPALLWSNFNLKQLGTDRQTDRQTENV